ncbi:hypothetical protein IT774_15355 [Salinimonas marina]|uniref:Uncharacterized protein n=1 Tax=Salinimonas marina TaxID=2785918 RepID=A0A7S9HCP1_9ALTE|nr:hypothetical protein [Salinimonas marina]QPG05451.1 hypothetical protein IT774_15355 [Salinimonas marina]
MQTITPAVAALPKKTGNMSQIAYLSLPVNKRNLCHFGGLKAGFGISCGLAALYGQKSTMNGKLVKVSVDEPADYLRKGFSVLGNYYIVFTRLYANLPVTMF